MAQLPSLHTQRWSRRRRLAWILVLSLCFPLLWAGSILLEWRTGRKLLPWTPYANCGTSKPKELPQRVKIGLYEEFPVPWRLEKLKQVDFPVSLALAAPSRAEFLVIRDYVREHFPQVETIYFWPLLERQEGYYPGAWSAHAAIHRAAAEAEGVPVLWDLEIPPDWNHFSPRDFPANRSFLRQWAAERQQPVHLWRTNTPLGLDPLALDLLGLHLDPLDFPQLRLHLDLYSKGEGLPRSLLQRILRCGVERYDDRFIPSFGLLNDGEGPQHLFLPPETLRRDLELARQAGVAEIWLFGVNGLNEPYLAALRDTLPVYEPDN